MKQVITNEAKTLEQMEAHITELTRQSIIKHIVNAVNSDTLIDTGKLRASVANDIKTSLNEITIFNSNGESIMNLTATKDGSFELSETIDAKTIAGL